MEVPIIKSMLDDDLYKFSMQQAVAKLYPHASVRYQFVNRGKTEFPNNFAHELRNQTESLLNVKLTKEEKKFLQEKCYYLDPVYIDFLAGYQYNPDEVKISQSDGHLSVSIEAPFYRGILWEVKLMAIISELYYKTAKNIQMTEECIASPTQVEERAAQKAIDLKKAGLTFADFGTRRRYSYDVQDRVVRSMIQNANVNFVGTSNVHLAMKYNTIPIGTMAHEWISFHAAKYGYRMANVKAMEAWSDVYNGWLGTALPDTFTSDDFFRVFDPFYAKLFDGVRHDSGDPIEFGEKVIAHYKKLRIDPLTKTIVFSDGLNVNEAIRIFNHFNGRIRISFGIGTFFTNDVGAKPLNMVIKLFACKMTNSDPWINCVKLSDVSGKHTGDPAEIELCQKTIHSALGR